MNIEPLERVTKEIMRRYNKKPEAWSVLADTRGNIIVLGPTLGYRLKFIALGPHKYTGVGAKVKNVKKLRDIVEGTPPYGFRPLSKNKIDVLFTALRRKGKLERRMVAELLEPKPISTGRLMKIKPRAILSGPVITHPDLSSISWRQRELERKLALEAEKLFRKRHPLRAEMYG